MRMTVRLRLGLAFGVVIAPAVAAAVLGISSLGLLNGTMVSMANGPALKLQWSEEILIDLIGVLRAEKNMILSSTPDQIDGYEHEIMALREHFIVLSDETNAIVKY